MVWKTLKPIICVYILFPFFTTFLLNQSSTLSFTYILHLTFSCTNLTIFYLWGEQTKNLQKQNNTAIPVQFSYFYFQIIVLNFKQKNQTCTVSINWFFSLDEMTNKNHVHTLPLVTAKFESGSRSPTLLKFSRQPIVMDSIKRVIIRYQCKINLVYCSFNSLKF